MAETTQSTTDTTTDQSTTDATTESQTIAQQYKEDSLPNPDPAHAAPSTDLNASGSIASPAVENPANDPTTNDVTQTPEERAAQARSDAMTNSAAERGTGLGEQSNTEEQV